MAKIIIYSTPTCVYCKMAKALFEEKKIPFEEKDVALDEAARSEMVEKSGQLGVPVIDIDGKIVVGFDRTKLLDLAGVK
jgi:glutaredoxin-like YruB-family protein